MNKHRCVNCGPDGIAHIETGIRRPAKVGRLRMKEVFTAVPAKPCGSHEDLSKEQRNLLSCPCGLADAGCYMIVWDGPGLGLVCDNKDDGERKAFMMNTAWRLAKGMTIDEIIKEGLK